MCKWGTTEIVEVTMQPLRDSGEEGDQYCEHHPDDIRCQGEWKKMCGIDKCIASIVRVLEENGIRMLASCCGHGKCDGNILLLDYSELVIPMDLTSNGKRMCME